MNNRGTSIWATVIVLIVCVVLIVPIITTITSVTDGLEKFTCEHLEVEKELVDITETHHVYNMVCQNCGSKTANDKTEKHTWDSTDKCTVCDYVCDHDYKEKIYNVYADDTRHMVEQRCSKCATTVEMKVVHNYNSSYFCKDCEHLCTHGAAKKTATDSGNDGGHTQKIECACGYTEEKKVGHSYNAKYKCALCGHACSHSSTTIGGCCSICKKPLEESASCKHPYFKDSVCETCGYVCTNHLVIGDEKFGFYCMYCNKAFDSSGNEIEEVE